MLSSIYLLRGAKNILRVKSEGKLYQSESYGVIVLNEKTSNPPKFAFIISNKISRMAVNRNRIKRALNETVRLNLVYIPKGVSFIFLVKKTIMEKSTDQIMKETEKFLKDKNYI